MSAMQKWDRYRFQANAGDYRPVLWPALGPYWCSGTGEGYSIIVAYFPHGTTEAVIRTYWPELDNLDLTHEATDIQFTDRFPRPTWWTGV